MTAPNPKIEQHAHSKPETITIHSPSPNKQYQDESSKKYRFVERQYTLAKTWVWRRRWLKNAWVAAMVAFFTIVAFQPTLFLTSPGIYLGLAITMICLDALIRISAKRYQQVTQGPNKEATLDLTWLPALMISYGFLLNAARLMHIPMVAQLPWLVQGDLVLRIGFMIVSVMLMASLYKKVSNKHDRSSTLRASIQKHYRHAAKTAWITMLTSLVGANHYLQSLTLGYIMFAITTLYGLFRIFTFTLKFNTTAIAKTAEKIQQDMTSFSAEPQSTISAASLKNDEIKAKENHDLSRLTSKNQRALKKVSHETFLSDHTDIPLAQQYELIY